MRKDEEGRPICYHCRQKGGVAAAMPIAIEVRGEWEWFHFDCYQEWFHSSIDQYWETKGVNPKEE